MSKYPRTYHVGNWSPGATSDDRISNNLDTLLGIDVVITEKLDGSNTCITKYGVYGRSHGDFSRNEWDKESWNIWNRIKKDIDNDVYIFGEGMEAIHSIEYKNLKSYFYIFGIRDNNIWLTWQSVEEYSYLLDIPTVPVLFKGKINSEKELKEIVENLVNQESLIGGEREGIVIRNANLFHNDDFKFNVMKWVRPNHVKTDKHWSRSWKKAKINY